MYWKIRSAIVEKLLVVLVAMLPCLTWAEPPKFTVENDRVILRGVSRDNPIIYDNDWWRDVPDAAYLWAKASLGEAKLKGNIVSRDMWDWQNGYQFKLVDSLNDAQSLFEAATQSGLRNIPLPISGADAALARPASGKIAETKFTRSTGSDLIVAEARKAAPEMPLLIFVGGPCTTVATAYLTDPTIADRVVVFQVDGGAYNGKDEWSWEIALQKMPFVNWADGYFWGEWSHWQPDHFDRLPMNPLDDSLRKYAHTDLGKANQWGDGPWIFALFEPRCITQVRPYKTKGLTVPREGTDIRKISDEFFETMSNPQVYHAASDPNAKTRK